MKAQSSIDKSELEDLISRSIEQTFGATFEEKLKAIQEKIIQGQVQMQPEVEEKKEEPPEKERSQLFDIEPFPLLQYLEEKGLDIIDKRSSGGTLWVVGGWELNEILFPLKEKKIYFKFTKKGSRSTKKKPGWFLLGK